MPQTQKLSRNNTTRHFNNELQRNEIILYSTLIVAYNDEMIKLDSGGWKKPLTKTRMNQASNQLGLGYLVYQKKGSWFVHYRTQDFPFFDGMLLVR